MCQSCVPEVLSRLPPSLSSLSASSLSTTTTTTSECKRPPMQAPVEEKKTHGFFSLHLLLSLTRTCSIATFFLLPPFWVMNASLSLWISSPWRHVHLEPLLVKGNFGRAPPYQSLRVGLVCGSLNLPPLFYFIDIVMDFKCYHLSFSNV